MSDHYREITDRIVAALETGVAPWAKPWTAGNGGGLPRNGVTGQAYSGINILLLWSTNFADSRWATYKQTQAAGGQVRTGSQGTKICFFKFIPRVVEDGEGGETKSNVPILRTFTVFNWGQIDWPEGHRFAAPADDIEDIDIPDTDADHYQAVRTAIDATKARIGVSLMGRACYVPAFDRIEIPPVESFDDAGSYWATVLHELGHWSGAPARCDRDLSGRFGSNCYAAEELVAELASAYLCATLSVDGHLQHAEYIDAWLKIMKADKYAVFTASRAASQAAEHVLSYSANVDLSSTSSVVAA